MATDAHDAQELVSDLLGISKDFILADHNHLRLGVSLYDMLALAERFCRDDKWIQAADVCDKALTGIKQFTMDYVGARMDPLFAHGAVHYYLATALVGDQRVNEALNNFNVSCKTFKDGANNQIAAAAVWLAIAELHSFRQEFEEALWALQFGRNLLETRPVPLAFDLVHRIDEEYAQAKTKFQKHMRDKPPLQRASSTKQRGDAPRQHSLSAFPVFTDLAAGKAIWMADDTVVEGQVEIERLHIQGKIYRVVNVANESSMLKLDSNKLYGVVRVKGNSMNRMKSKFSGDRAIDDGDYVLLCASRGGRYDAREGDIVAATLQDASGLRGVVKRFRFIKGEAQLLSESDDPNEGDILLEEMQGEIFAQVVAVLKPYAPEK